ncbi:MAG: peptide MFS transporter [Pseudomonadota bacterium]
MKLFPFGAQPKGFAILFYAQFCERYGFYTSFYLLVPFAIGTLGLSQINATLLFGTYTGLIFSTAFAGGIIGDRLLGYRKSITAGLILMGCGSLLLASGSTTIVYFGLALMLVGNGYFMPNVSSLLGLQFSKEDTRRDSTFTLFYISTNIGAAAAALCSGVLARQFGFPSAFLFATAVTLTACVPLYVRGGGLKGDDVQEARRRLWRTDALGVPNLAWLALGTSGAVVLGHLMLNHTRFTGGVLFAALGLALAYFLREILRLEEQSRRNGVVMILLFGFGVIFWALYNQNGASVLLFAEQAVDRTIFGAEIPASAFLSLNPIFIFISAPAMALLWLYLSSRQVSISYGLRFVAGFVLIGGAFALLGLVPQGPDNLVAARWIIGFFFIYSIAELCISPIALSMISHLATKELLGFAMGLWLLIHAVGNYSSGLLAGLASVPSGASAQETVTVGQSAFLDFSLIALSAGVLLFLLFPVLNRLTKA